MRMREMEIYIEDGEIIIDETIMIGQTGDDAGIRLPKEQALIVAAEIVRLAALLPETGNEYHG